MAARVRHVAVLLIAFVAVRATSAQNRPQPTPQTFRARATLVPLDVRVVDKKGKPVGDLKAEDFTVFENGVKQEIKHFVPIVLTPASTATAPAAPTATDRSATADIAPQTRRVFLIVLGRGNLQIPSKGLDGAIHLVRDLLLPQDVVALVAWNRATPFTTDHESVARALERYKAGHQAIENTLAEQTRGLAGIYGDRDAISPPLQRSVESILRGDGGAALQTITRDPAATTNVDRATDEDIRRRQDDDLTLFANGGAPPEMSLDEYVSHAVQASQDEGNIYAGLAYLQHVDGEKHLLFITPRGINTPMRSAADDQRLAAVASDARVVIDIFHTSGTSGGSGIGFAPMAGAAPVMAGSTPVSGGEGGGGYVSAASGRLATINVQSQFNGALGAMFDVSSSEIIAEQTGGQFTSLTYGKNFVEQIDSTSRAGYQLGYYSTNPAFDNKFRKISVKVNRRGLTLMYRHGYLARDTPPALDRRQVISASRVVATARYSEAVRDLELAVTAVPRKTPKGQREMVVQIHLDPKGVIPSDLFGRHNASLDVAVFCGDGQELIVCKTWNQVDLNLDEPAFARFQNGGAMLQVNAPLRRDAKYVKVVVYDYTTDKAGSAVVKLK